MKITLLIAVLFFATGCAENPTGVRKSRDNITEYSYIDEEAAKLGFPEYFISKESESIDWSQADSSVVSDMNVQIFDTGKTVEVCGGLGCDK